VIFSGCGVQAEKGKRGLKNLKKKVNHYITNRDNGICVTISNICIVFNVTTRGIKLRILNFESYFYCTIFTQYNNSVRDEQICSFVTKYRRLNR
jgi:hypothetical protein